MPKHYLFLTSATAFLPVGVVDVDVPGQAKVRHLADHSLRLVATLTNFFSPSLMFRSLLFDI